MTTIAVCSLLHEAAGAGSADRRFRNEPVLRWTLRRLALTRRVVRVVVLAWDDQLESLADADVVARSCGPRRPMPQLASIAAAQRWAEGWRGGLLQSCWFDNGFDAAFVRDAMADEQADNVVLIDPAAGLVDPHIIDELVEAADKGSREFYFTQAAPGLGGVLLRKNLVESFAKTAAMPGRLVHYLPDAPVLDPITSDACVAVPLELSRTADRFDLGSERQVRRIERATLPLNGTLVSSRSPAIVKRIVSTPSPKALPRDVVIELTTRRSSRPTFSPIGRLPVERPDMTRDCFDNLLEQLGGDDDRRVTLAGVGDPILHPCFADWIGRLTQVAAVSIETDLIDSSAPTLQAIVRAGVDVVAVNLPATSPQTYAKVMGVDRMAVVLENLRRLLELRTAHARGVPVVAPLFTKLLANFDEMEAWYDTWLRAVGSAVIVGPSTFGNRLDADEVADMTPPVRRPCVRLSNRMTVLSDGTIAACDQTVCGELSLGHTSGTTLAAAWHGPQAQLHQRHLSLTQLPDPCTRCNEWHRP